MEEEFSERLIAYIDEVVADLYEQHDGSSNTQLQLEATVIGKGKTRRRTSNKTHKIVLEKSEIGNWRSPVQTPDSAQNSESRPSTADSHEKSAQPEVNAQQLEQFDDHQNVAANEGRPRRKTVGGLRVGTLDTPSTTPSPSGTRQLATDQRNFPKRRRLEEGPAKLEPSTVDKLIEGIWEQIHRPNSLVIPEDISSTFQQNGQASLDFADVSRRCRVLTGVSRTTRSIEVMMQAHWVDCYHGRIDALKEQRPDLRPHEHKKLVMTEACNSFEWSEKDLRNRTAIWKGYREIKDAAGWAALAFAGPGIYRFCKYRMGFDQEAIVKLQTLQSRFELAADTIQPQWRQTLTLVGISDQRVYRGHPHDWVVGKRKDPVPLAWTYRQWDPNFSFSHLKTSIIDLDAFGAYDPRRVHCGPHYLCSLCSKPQSEIAERNECDCFGDLFGPNARSLCPVQVYSMDDGRNNGLVACCPFERGTPIGEFVGIVTKDLEDVDVMQCQGAAGVTYQIWQGRSGNFTKFINHSCVPNCQFQSFIWLGVQRTIVVSKGVAAGQELTVDYSDQYWSRLQKTCLCKQAACRFRDR